MMRICREKAYVFHSNCHAKKGEGMPAYRIPSIDGMTMALMNRTCPPKGDALNKTCKT